jgi:hypothetical protein
MAEVPDSKSGPLKFEGQKRHFTVPEPTALARNASVCQTLRPWSPAAWSGLWPAKSAVSANSQRLGHELTYLQTARFDDRADFAARVGRPACCESVASLARRVGLGARPTHGLRSNSLRIKRGTRRSGAAIGNDWPTDGTGRGSAEVAGSGQRNACNACHCSPCSPVFALRPSGRNPAVGERTRGPRATRRRHTDYCHQETRRSKTKNQA